MHKKQLLIASVLKPIDDTRMVEKLGFSLDKINGFQINIVGFCGKIPTNSNLKFFPLFNFRRLDILRRLSAPIKFYSKLRKIKPSIIILETHELLLPAIIYKKFNNATVIYDIRENYFLNIKNGSGFSTLTRDLVAFWVRAVEKLCSKYIDHFFIAESIYKDQIKFIHNRFTYLPNAFNDAFNESVLTKHKKERNKYQVLFSGTIALETGIRESINLINKLHQLDDRYKLVVRGYCSNHDLFISLQKEIFSLEHIDYPQENKLIPHSEILDAIQLSGFGFIHYHALPQFEGKIPTKFFEYLSSNLPIILYDNKRFVDIETGTNSIIHLEQGIDEDLQKIIQFRSPKNINDVPKHFLWNNYEPILISIVESMK